VDPIPWEIAAPVAGALVTAVGALWRDRNHWQRKWANEVKTTAPVLRRLRRNVEAAQGTPPSEPPNPWDDNTEVRSRMLSEDRRWIDQASVDSELQRFLESTPPRLRKP
jgi:hypothetical protein